MHVVHVAESALIHRGTEMHTHTNTHTNCTKTQKPHHRPWERRHKFCMRIHTHHRVERRVTRARTFSFFWERTVRCRSRRKSHTLTVTHKLHNTHMCFTYAWNPHKVDAAHLKTFLQMHRHNHIHSNFHLDVAKYVFSQLKSHTEMQYEYLWDVSRAMLCNSEIVFFFCLYWPPQSASG